MKLTVENVKQISRVILPEVYSWREKTPYGSIQRRESDALTLAGSAKSLASKRNQISSLLVSRASGEEFSLGAEVDGDFFAPAGAHFQCNLLELREDVLFAGAATGWLNYPQKVSEDRLKAHDDIRESWEGGLRFTLEMRNPDGKIARKGLRPPQIGALHALAAHHTVSEKPALLVMPTGTGKTEVMIAALLVNRPTRLLVLVPTDALRSQTIKKFSGLGILRDVNVLEESEDRPVLNPSIAEIKHLPKHDSDWDSLRGAHVAVATVAAIQGMAPSLLQSFLEMFDSIFFDEAHHVRAKSWETVYGQVELRKNVVMFTATPFRQDGLRLPGKIIYDFPLRIAQAQQYFRKIRFTEVWEFSGRDKADMEIAAKAVEQLRSDISEGYDHILMARVDTQERADKLCEDVYEKLYPEFAPVAIHSASPGRKKVEEAIRAGKHRIVVCVDMFGEGFDMPQLKIAALHDRHQSLAVTLQFTGRFVRDASGIGDPTLVANLGDERVSDAIEELYAEDADWNILIPQLSAKAIESQLNFSEFLDRMDFHDDAGEKSFGLNVLHPKMSTVVYRQAKSFRPQRFRRAVRKNDKIVNHWTSKDKDLLIFITKSRSPIEWATVKDESDITWNLWVVAHDATRHLLFIHSSSKGSLHRDLAQAVASAEAKIIEGEPIFRGFHGIERLTFHNVGLHYRGSTKQRFRMSTGLDVGEAITPIEQSGATKCNLFAVGYERGRRASIGASAKGRIWSMRSCSIPDWRQWCAAVASKLLDNTIAENSFLNHTLIPTEIDRLPGVTIFGVFMPHEWYGSEMEGVKLYAEASARDFHDFGLVDHSVVNDREVILKMGWESCDEVEFRLTWGPKVGEFSVKQIQGLSVEIQNKGSRTRLAQYFEEHPPSLLLPDSGEVTGGQLRAPRRNMVSAYKTDEIVAIDWKQTNFGTESKWKDGMLRSNTIQGHTIELTKQGPATIIYDDDDRNEAADIIEIFDDGTHMTFRLYHCKFAGGNSPAGRVKDLEVVCNQAVRSVRWANDPEFLLAHMRSRESDGSRRGRLTRFERGDLKLLSSVRRTLRKRLRRFEIVIVQPGLSRVACEPELATMLGAASAFIFQVTNQPLRVWGSK